MDFKQSFLNLTIHNKKRTQKTQPKCRKKERVEVTPPPKEFLCPITNTLMTDPVIVPSGHTFQRATVAACKNLNYTPALPDGTAVPDLSAPIPNLALRATILKWLSNHSDSLEITFQPLDISSAEKLLRDKIEREDLLRRVADIPPVKLDHAVTELTLLPHSHFVSPSESAESTPLQLATRPSCFSPASTTSSSEEPLDDDVEEEELFKKLKSPQVHVVEEALVGLRKTTRAHQEKRAHLCSTKLLSLLKSLSISRYVSLQVNAVACLVNLSLEKVNKVKMVRAGVVPFLIEVMKCGAHEAQEHACGALFSLALDDFNKTAIGVLGALPPLLNLLGSSTSELARNDSALALYHLSFVRSNRSKLIKVGAVPFLLGLVGPDKVAGRVLLVLSNLAACSVGRAAMLDSGGVARLVGVLSRDDLGSESTREACVSVLCGLSHGGVRFRGLAKAVGAVEVLARVESGGSERCRAMVRRILEVMKARVEEEEVDWEELLDSGEFSRTRSRLGSCVKGESKVKSSEF